MNAILAGEFVRAIALLIACAGSARALSAAAASPAAASSAEPEPEPEPVTAPPVDHSQERVCHREKETGSYIGKKVCRTRAEEELALCAARN